MDVKSVKVIKIIVFEIFEFYLLTFLDDPMSLEQINVQDTKSSPIHNGKL